MKHLNDSCVKIIYKVRYILKTHTHSNGLNEIYCWNGCSLISCIVQYINNILFLQLIGQLKDD